MLLAELSLALARTDETLPLILSPRSCGMLVGGMATHSPSGEYSRPKVPKVVGNSTADPQMSATTTHENVFRIRASVDFERNGKEGPRQKSFNTWPRKTDQFSHNPLDESSDV